MKHVVPPVCAEGWLWPQVASFTHCASLSSLEFRPDEGSVNRETMWIRSFGDGLL